MISADTIIVNGKVATIDKSFSFKEAIAIKDGWIIDVGTNNEIEKYLGPRTKTIDLHGKLVMPAAHDSHIHALIFVMNNLCLNCGAPSVKSLAELKAKLTEEANRLPDGAWIRGANLNSDDFPECKGKGITRWDIDEATGGHPTILQDWSAHGALANSKALELSGIDSTTPDPAGGFFVKNVNGEMTGYLQEASASFLVYKNVPLWTDEELTEGILKAQELLNSEGYAGYTECTLGPANNLREYGAAGERAIYLYKKLADEGRLTARVSIGFYSGVNGVQSYEFLKQDLDSFEFPEAADSMWYKIKMVKIFCDGVHIFHSGWMLEDYADMPGNRGRSVLGREGATDEEQVAELKRMVQLAHNRGFQVGVHAIGDRAIEETLNAFIKANQENPGKNLRHYVIHADSLGWPQQAKKAAKYRIPYSVQPAISDHAFEATVDVVGPRGERCFDLKTPLSEGIILCGGSDAISGVFPHWRKSVQSAVNRRSAITGNIFAPDLRISVEDAVKLFTINAAYQEHMEEVRGSIEPGKVADFQVLDRDIFETPPDEIANIAVIMTIVDGKIVYEKTY